MLNDKLYDVICWFYVFQIVKSDCIEVILYQLFNKDINGWE